VGWRGRVRALNPGWRAYIERVPQATSAASRDTVDVLVLDLLEWIGPGARPYVEVLDAWRTSCPRLPVWEDATDRGFIARHNRPGHGALVSVSSAGAEHLRKHRPSAARCFS
jgi:hypothetical protein